MVVKVWRFHFPSKTSFPRHRSSFAIYESRTGKKKISARIVMLPYHCTWNSTMFKCVIIAYLFKVKLYCTLHLFYSQTSRWGKSSTVKTIYALQKKSFGPTDSKQKNLSARETRITDYTKGFWGYSLKHESKQREKNKKKQITLLGNGKHKKYSPTNRLQVK